LIFRSQSAPGVQEMKSSSSTSAADTELLNEVQDFMSQLKDVNIDHLLEPFPIPEFVKQQE